VGARGIEALRLGRGMKKSFVLYGNVLIDLGNKREEEEGW
jgi:hypothetical protein